MLEDIHLVMQEDTPLAMLQDTHLAMLQDTPLAMLEDTHLATQQDTPLARVNSIICNSCLMMLRYSSLVIRGSI
jgi:hypothetical protein